jgi:hypothetical protein
MLAGDSKQDLKDQASNSLPLVLAAMAVVLSKLRLAAVGTSLAP